MIFGADKQNKNLRIASTIKTNPNLKTRTANKYAAAISSSKTAGNSSFARNQKTTEYQPSKNLNNGNPDPMRGSLEGLDNGKSTYIQMDNRGYDSNSLKTARYADRNKTINPQGSANFLFTNRQKEGIINNYTNITMAGSSSDRLNKSLNINRMF